jgi:hypothetical protein
MSSAPTLGSAVLDKAYSYVDGGLASAANGAEKINHAIFPIPPGTTSEDTVEGTYHSAIARLIDGIRGQIKRGLPFTLSLQNALAIVDATVTSNFDGGLDDRLMLVCSTPSFPPSSHKS